jgi:hypothetical protein
MSISQDDFIGSLLDHQARVNFALDDGDVNSLVTDLYPLNVEEIGMGSDVANTSTTVPPHLYDDGQSAYGFCSYA